MKANGIADHMKGIKMNEHTKNIANTIFAQMGGNGFARMVGLVNPYLVRNDEEKAEITVTFRWKAKGKDGLNFVEVTLVEALDTYRMTFGRLTVKNIRHIDPIDDVYCDQLQSIFRDVTGLEPGLPVVYIME